MQTRRRVQKTASAPPPTKGLATPRGDSHGAISAWPALGSERGIALSGLEIRLGEVLRASGVGVGGGRANRKERRLHRGAGEEVLSRIHNIETYRRPRSGCCSSGRLLPTNLRFAREAVN